MSQLLSAPDTAAAIGAASRADEWDDEFGSDAQRIFDPRQEIAELEAEIEELSDSAARCRKIIKASKLAAGLGGVLIPLVVTGVLSLSPLALVTGISAVVGGIALIGSTASTLDELTAAVDAREARRAELIDRLSLRMIDIDAEQDGSP
jgi:hypothetical protein